MASNALFIDRVGKSAKPLRNWDMKKSFKVGLVAAILAAGCIACECLAESGGASGWPAAMLARRAQVLGSVKAHESQWFTAGPFQVKSFDDAQWPEKGSINLDAKGPNGRPLWSELKRNNQNGVVNQLKAGANTATYLCRILTAKAPGKVVASLGSDDGLAVWFNGEKLLARNVARGAAPDQDTVTLNIKPGTNYLLLKIYNISGDCGFYYQAGTSYGGMLDGVASKFPEETELFRTYFAGGEQWFQKPESTEMEQRAIRNLLKRLSDGGNIEKRLEELVRAGTSPTNTAWLELFLDVARKVRAQDQLVASLDAINLPALRRAVEDLTRSFPDRYPRGPGYLKELDRIEKEWPEVKKAVATGDAKALALAQRWVELQRKALLENPLLDFEKLLVVKRNESNLGLPHNWQGNSSMNPRVENEIATMAYKEPGAPLKTLYKPATNYWVGDVDLNYDADKMLFSSIGSHGRWQIFEVKVDGTGLRQVTPATEPDIDSYDAIYLPDGRIIYDSSSTFQGVPCVGGSDYVANLHIMNADGTNIRRLCFDQDNDWCPVMLPNGRVMYLRWEYTDSAHYFSRVLMSMNPDGTGQAEYYGSDSYWPNSLFFARPIPGSETMFVGIVSGHHGVPRMGELVLFDASRGRQEDKGAVQRIPGWGQPVVGPTKDTLVDGSWPKFLHPYPLNDKYFLVSAKPTPQSRWGIYLVDVFDNMLLLKEVPGYALFEPLPLKPTPRPPVIPDKVRLNETNAVVYLHDIYSGDGLKGVPRGTVKSLRLFQYEYSYRNMGGHYYVGMEGPWDVRRIIGTVPLRPDGSALFTIPANTPVAVQPLDNEGKALQIFRSWFVGMPGEYVSCVGCHERQNQSSTLQPALASRAVPVAPTPWRGPKRGFSFLREVQPVLDQYCSGCHNGQPGRPNFAETNIVRTSGGITSLPKSYLELHPWVRRNGPEGDYHTLTPLEFHADTSLLVQMLKKGHYNVKLDDEAWDRLITWIDLNVPAYGSFSEGHKIPADFEKRRYECKKKYANVDEDIETLPPLPGRRPFVAPPPMPPRPPVLVFDGWPLGAEKAKRLQEALGEIEMQLDLGQGVVMKFRHIPAGEFAMGDSENGAPDEYPMARVKIERPFWIGATEVTLQQYQRFDPLHKNGYYDMHYKDQVKPGYLMDFPQKPVIRVSWKEAMQFCRWLSSRTGRKVTLPTEAQWEWACRAGAASPMYYGGVDTDFSATANLADASLSRLAVSGVNPQPIPNPDKFWDFVPKDARFNDGEVHLADVGKYRPNIWGLYDMIGNVAEWTLDNYRPYPYQPNASRFDEQNEGRKVVRGGSWADRPKEARAASRLDYPAWQKVYNVGFRVVILD